MGTFLKVVGIIIIILAILGLIISIFSGNFLNNLVENLKYYDSDVYNTLNSVITILQGTIIVISTIFSFFTVIFGASLFVLGSIYNDVKKLIERFKSIEIVKE